MNLNDWTTLTADPRLYRALEAVHLIGLSSLFGGLLLLELRLLGWQRGLEVRAMTRLVVPVALSGFALCLVSGAAMFASQPEELWVNSAFRLKMLLIVLAGVNAAWFHVCLAPATPDRRVKFQALVSLVLWAAVIVCGRWIAVV